MEMLPGTEGRKQRAMTVSYEKCLETVARIFERAGVQRERAYQLADLFVTTEAKGVWSHGVGLVLKYTEQFLKRTINTEPDIRILKKFPSCAVMDEDEGPGIKVLEQAISLAVTMADETGVGSVTITNLQHYAAGLYYAPGVTAKGKILTLMANSPASMAPYGGTEKYYGTNPFTFAAPMGELPCYCLDMASSVCAGNKLENAMNLGESVPEGLGLDRNGRPTTDPEEILLHGSLLPFGGAKGSGIAGMVNIMAGILSGGAYETDVISLCRDVKKPANYGCYVQVLDIAKFMDMKEYNRRAEKWGRAVLANPPAKEAGQVVYPGYLEELRYREAQENGLKLSDISLRNLKLAAELVGINSEKLFKKIAV